MGGCRRCCWWAARSWRRRGQSARRGCALHGESILPRIKLNGEEMSRVKNSDSLIGERFGRLTVASQDGKRGDRRLWLCLCDCGNETRVTTSNLKFGAVSSCGCLAREVTSARSTIHGGRSTRLYSIWHAMKARCSLPYPHHKYHHGLGVSICKEWASSFAAFRDWAVLNGYSDDLSIDRIDNDGDYEPDNCRWATCRQQRLNSRVTLKTSGGDPAVIVAVLNGINRATFYSRLNSGWSVDDAANIIPTNKNRHERFKRYAAADN